MDVIHFKYNLNEKVLTPFHEVGFIQTQAVDAGGIMYDVQTMHIDRWHREDTLRKWKEELKDK